MSAGDRVRVLRRGATRARRLEGMSSPSWSTSSTAFYLQSAISFAVSTTGVALGVVYLPVGTWVRAFLALGLLYVITSTFTLAKCIRDRQEKVAVHEADQQAAAMPANGPYPDGVARPWA
jgi:hypothetical protein